MSMSSKGIVVWWVGGSGSVVFETDFGVGRRFEVMCISISMIRLCKCHTPST